MRSFFSSVFRLVAGVLLMTVLTSGIAMAAYVCPALMNPAMPEMMKGMPCADMDMEKPVHCAEFQASDDFALEHLAAAPALTPPTVTSAMPVTEPAIPHFPAASLPDLSSEAGADPPYLRTLRLRI